MKDAELKVTKYLPAAAANNTSPSIDLEITDSLARSERAPVKVIKVTVPAMPNHTDAAKTITLDLHDSADDAAFAETAPLIQCKIIGVADTGSVAKEFTFALPATKRYVAFKQTVPADAGDNTAVQITYELEF